MVAEREPDGGGGRALAPFVAVEEPRGYPVQARLCRGRGRVGLTRMNVGTLRFEHDGDDVGKSMVRLTSSKGRDSHEESSRCSTLSLSCASWMMGRMPGEVRIRTEERSRGGEEREKETGHPAAFRTLAASSSSPRSHHPSASEPPRSHSQVPTTSACADIPRGAGSTLPRAPHTAEISRNLFFALGSIRAVKEVDICDSLE